MSELADQQQRDLIRNNLDINLVVEAAAGTGKTSELVRRIIAIIAKGRTTVDRLVAVTFTEKAAGELKLRLRVGLEEARSAASPGTVEYNNLRNAVARLEEARVSTIHGFCADLLRERPIEARVDPEFKVLTEDQAARLFDQTFSRWLQAKLEDLPEGLRRSLRRSSAYKDDGPSDRLRRAAWEIVEWRDHPTPWRRDSFDREERIDTLVDLVHQFANLTRNCSSPERDRLYQDTAPVRQLSDEIQRFEQVRGRDYDGLEAALIALLSDLRNPRTGYGQYYAKDLSRDTVVTACNNLRTALEQFQMAADADLAAALRDQLFEVVEHYENAKQRAGCIDFLDLLLRARNLIRDCEPVRAHFQRRFSHLLVDEFQDTDPLQAEILLLLASKDPTISDWRAVDPVGGKLFIVGDPKQSIYRFRRADVGVYQRVKKQLEARGSRVVQLSTSFRSVPSIQRAINHAFAQVMQEDANTLQASYEPLSPFREETGDQPTIVALPVPAPYGKTRITKESIERSLPDAVAAFVQWLVYESGWTITERDDHAKRVPIGARHICLLLRRFQGYGGDLTRGYAQALEARGIPHLLVGGRSFHSREEVETMRSALSAIEWPDDELSLFATLHGSLFAIGDAELLSYRYRYGRLHPFRRPKETVAEPLRPIVAALELLADLHRQRNQRPVSDTIARLLEATRSPAGFVLRPSGEQVLANVQHVAELARAYEQTGGLSFRGFVDQLLVDAERGESPEALILEEGSDGVRIMTTHKAKGLEFPVVILADITAKPTGRANRYVDSERGLAAVRIAGWAPAELVEHADAEIRRDEAEAVRLAYVAATRARDLLVVPAVGDEPFNTGWISCLNTAIYPSALSLKRAKRAPGCPEFGDDSVLDRNGHQPPSHGSVRPGWHVLTLPNYGVVWWDPKTLALHIPRQFGIRQEELLGKKTDRAIVEVDLLRYRDWESSRASAIDIAAQPTLQLVTATQLARRESPAASQVEVIQLPRDKNRPGGRRFGALVHAMLATVSLRAERDEIEQTSRVQMRILGALQEEREAAVEVVAAVLRHPLLGAAADASERGECRRETPVTLRLSDGTLVEGSIDLAFKDGHRWRVIDFKTDRELEHAAAVYERQVALYAEAIRASTGRETQAVLLVV